MRMFEACAAATLLAASVGPTAFADYNGSWRYRGSELAFEQVGAGILVRQGVRRAADRKRHDLQSMEA